MQLNISDWEVCEKNYRRENVKMMIKDPPLPVQCDDRARRSLPEGLVLKESTIPGAGLGIFADVFFQKGVQFTPYEGRTYAYNQVDADRSGYSWLVRDRPFNVQGREGAGLFFRN